MNRKPWDEDEIDTLKALVGKASAADIGNALGRSRESVAYKIRNLKLDGRLRGEDHTSAKLSNLQTEMLRVLYDAGFDIYEIHKGCFPHVHRSTVSNIANKLTRDK